jgi:hypothetical protein
VCLPNDLKKRGRFDLIVAKKRSKKNLYKKVKKYIYIVIIFVFE